MTRAQQVRFKVGERIGDDVTVLGVVDDGGRRPVYIVWHDEFWCPMACKVFGSARSAQYEAGILARLSHPYIIRSFGTYSSRFLLTEYLEGPTLSRLLRTSARGRFAIADAMRVAIHLGAALAHVHQRGYIHLDVKPSNVVVVRNRPILFDFGLARRHSYRRRPHLVHGTDPYIAPEECMLKPTGPAADVFGLGVTVYQLITGKLPFPEPTRKNPFPQTETTATPLRKRRRDVPVELEKLIGGCLTRDPAARITLPKLIPALHRFVTKGARMWPAGFDPAGR
jgi:serine/threonine protein kinase